MTTKTKPASHAASAAGDLFDARRVRQFAEMMNELAMTELDIQHGESRILLRRGGTATPTASVTPQHVHTVAATAPVATAVPATDDAHIAFVKSPMVGTFYSAPKPDSPPYIKVGDVVSGDKTVCIIEAMKVYNEIQAEVSGKVIAVLVKNGDSVDVNKPLFKIDTRG